MQISKVNSNYNYKNSQQPAFKGRAEQKLFMQIVEQNKGLLEATKTASKQKWLKPVADHLAKAFDGLKEAFRAKGFKIEDVPSDVTEEFMFIKSEAGVEDEAIRIVFHETDHDWVELRYIESQLRQGNPGYTYGQTQVYNNIIYDTPTHSLKSLQDDNYLLRRQHAYGIQNYDNIDRTPPGERSTLTHYAEYLDLETGRFMNRTPLKVEQG